jgi:hypothetical protein
MYVFHSFSPLSSLLSPLSSLFLSPLSFSPLSLSLSLLFFSSLLSI